MSGLTIIIFVVCFCASVAGSICGIGGGVIIKPVLDALDIMSVSTISFLSGCTVLSMSVISVYKNFRRKKEVNLERNIFLALGAVLGGVGGKLAFSSLRDMVGNESLVGMAQSAILLLVTFGTLIYTLMGERIRTRECIQIWVLILIGIALGMMSSFLRQFAGIRDPR